MHNKTRQSEDRLHKLASVTYSAAPTPEEMGQKRRRAFAGGYRSQDTTRNLQDMRRARQDVQATHRIPRYGTREYAQWALSPEGRDIIETYASPEERESYLEHQNKLRLVAQPDSEKGWWQRRLSGMYEGSVAKAQQNTLRNAQSAQQQYETQKNQAIRKYAPLAIGGAGLLGLGLFAGRRGRTGVRGAPPVSTQTESPLAPQGQQAFRLDNSDKPVPAAPGSKPAMGQQAFRTGYTQGGSNV